MDGRGIFGGSGDEVSHGGALYVFGDDVVPVGVEGLVVEEEPGGEWVFARDVSLHDIDESVDVVGE